MNWQLHEALRSLSSGGIIACPTETVYGLSCDPFNGRAVMRLLLLKQRNINQGLILIASDLAQLTPLLLPLTAATRKRISARSSEPVTWVLPCLPEIPVWLRGEHDSLAVRVTSHPLASALCRQWGGPLVSTSANLHGRKPAQHALAVRKAFAGQIDFVLNAHMTRNAKPSRIRNGITGELLRS